MRMLKSARHLIVFSVVSNVLLLVAPVHMMQVYDRVLVSSSGETLFYISLIAVVMLSIYGFSELLRSRMATKLSAQYVLEYADPVFKSISNGSVEIENSQKVMREFDNVRQFIASRTMVCLFDLPFAPVFLLLLFLLHIQIGILTLLGGLALVGIALLNKMSTATDLESVSKASSETAVFSQIISQSSEDIRAMGLLPDMMERWGRLTAAGMIAADASSKKNSTFFGISKSVRQILQVSIMAWGAWLVLNGNMTGGMIFAASMISGRVLQPIEQVIGGWDRINSAYNSHSSILKTIEESQSETAKIEQPMPIGNLKVDKLSINIAGMDGYNRELLNNISLEVGPSNITAIIGASGSGKSTLIRAISGAQTDYEGDVFLDGCAQKNWPIEQWGRSVGYVGQDVQLFPGTVAENIARMSNNVRDEKVIQAAILADCHELINSLPAGYNTSLGSGGVRLSGGQKQRIALARALYFEPKLLVLDEPNSNLDQAGEQKLLQVLQTQRNAGAAVLIVTQRRNVLSIADRVLLLEKGRITEVDVGNYARRKGSANGAPRQKLVTTHPKNGLANNLTADSEV